MKNLRASIVIFAVLLFASTSVFSQAEVSTVDVPIAVLIPCANDGDGEVASGVLQIHFVQKDGVSLAHPQGGTLTGLETGISYQATGVTRESSGDNGLTFVNRFHFVGKGTQFFVKQTAHFTMNANGDITVAFNNFEVICK